MSVHKRDRQGTKRTRPGRNQHSEDEYPPPDHPFRGHCEAVQVDGRSIVRRGALKNVGPPVVTTTRRAVASVRALCVRGDASPAWSGGAVKREALHVDGPLAALTGCRIVVCTGHSLGNGKTPVRSVNAARRRAERCGLRPGRCPERTHVVVSAGRAVSAWPRLHGCCWLRYRVAASGVTAAQKAGISRRLDGSPLIPQGHCVGSWSPAVADLVLASLVSLGPS